MATAPLMRAASSPVQLHLVHHNHAAGVSSLPGRNRRCASLSSARYVHLVGRRASARFHRVSSEANLAGSDGALGSREDQEERNVKERKGVGTLGIRNGAGLAVTEEVAVAGGGAGSGRRAGGGGAGRGGGGKGSREGTGGGQSEMGAYYQEMLEADPGNPLLLTNYGKFLHEVEGDVAGAEECYGRAILVSPGDGEVLSLYGKLMWEAHRDEDRAEAYFERAVEASPDDCYVLGSYAHFLWDAEEEEEKASSSPTPPSSQQPPHHLVKAY